MFKVGPDFLHKKVVSKSLSIYSITNNKQSDTVLPNDNTNEHLENKKTKVTNSACKKQSNFASKINWRRYSSFFTLTCHVVWIIKLKTNWIKRKRGVLMRKSFSFFAAIESASSRPLLLQVMELEYFLKNSKHCHQEL